MNAKTGKRVTFVLTQSLECPSGVGRYWPLAWGLARRGYQVRVVALHPNYAALSERRFVREGVEVWYVAQMHVRKEGNLKFYFSPWQLLWVVFLATLKLTWAAVVSPGDWYQLGKAQPINGVAGLALLLLGRRVYLDCDDYETTSNQFGAGWQRKVVAWFEDGMPRLARGVTVNTHFLLERIRAVVPASRPVILVPNGVDLADFEPPEPARVAALRAQLGVEGRPVVIYVGSLSLVNHPVDLLLKSFGEKVLPRVPQAVLLIAGGGPDLEALQAQAAAMGESVRFLGRIPHAEILCYYAAADLSVDPVLADETAAARSPLKLYESLAVGTPVLTGAVGDRCDLLQECPSMLVPAGDASALGLRMAHLLLDEPRRAAAQAWAREQQKQFLWESRIDTFVKVYDA